MKKLVLGALIVSGLGIGASTFAYQGNPAVKNPNPVDSIRHEAMQKALETKDYATWKTLMEGKGVLNRVTTQEQFNKFVQMREAFDSGDTSTAQKLQAELGLGQKKMDGTGMKKGMKQGGGKNRITQ